MGSSSREATTTHMWAGQNSSFRKKGRYLGGARQEFHEPRPKWPGRDIEFQQPDHTMGISGSAKEELEKSRPMWTGRDRELQPVCHI